jgi:hypothetical protein
MSTDDTTASEHGADAETTQVPPRPPGDEPGLAWSLDHDDDETPIDWRGRLMWAGLSVLVIAVAAALVLLISTLFGGHATNTARTRPVPSPPLTLIFQPACDDLVFGGLVGGDCALMGVGSCWVIA